jgi:hypothetical protein
MAAAPTCPELILSSWRMLYAWLKHVRHHRGQYHPNGDAYNRTTTALIDRYDVVSPVKPDAGVNKTQHIPSDVWHWVPASGTCVFEIPPEGVLMWSRSSVCVLGTIKFQSPFEKGIEKILQCRFLCRARIRMLLSYIESSADHLLSSHDLPASRPTNLYLPPSNLSSMTVDLSGLDASLQEALEPPYVGNTHAIVQALLEVKPHLLRLFDVGTRNVEEKKEVGSGPSFVPLGYHHC